MLGHVLYLEAEAAGIRATGIGCYFDDAFHEIFGLADDRFQSLYHFTVGMPVELWAWPWTDWPLYDPSVFERDLARIERWYRARGYYDASGRAPYEGGWRKPIPASPR